MSRIHSFRNYTVLSGSAGYPARISVTGTAVQLSVPAAANAATIRIISNGSTTAGSPAVNYKLDGTNPTSSTGMPLFNGDVLELYQSEPGSIRIISADGNAQTVCVEFAVVI